MDAFPEFPEGYEPSYNEILAQGGRRLRNNDRSAPNSLIGLTRVPFDDGTTMDFEFYKPTVYEHEGIPYSVLVSTVLRTYHGGDEGALSDLKVYLNLKNPNEDEFHYSYFTITNYGAENQVMGELSFLQLDIMVQEHEEAYDLYNFLYDYGTDGVAIKDDGGYIMDMRYWIPQNENQVQNEEQFQN